MLALSVPAPTSRANLTGCSNRTRLIRRSPLVLSVQGGFAISGGRSLALLLRLARHAVTIRIKTRAVTRLTTMQRRRTSRTSISACFVVNTRPRRSLLNRLRGSLLSGSLSRRRLRGCLLDGRLRSYRRLLNRSFLLNRLSLLRGSLRNRSCRRLCGRRLSSRCLHGSLSRRNRRRSYRRRRRLRRSRRRTRRRRRTRGSRSGRRSRRRR